MGVLLTGGCLFPDAGELRAAPGGCEAAAHQGGLQQGAAGGVQGRGLRPPQQRREGQVPGPRQLQDQGGRVREKTAGKRKPSAEAANVC